MDHTAYLPHGICLLWNWWLVAPFVIGNSAVAAAYFAMPWEVVRAYRGSIDSLSSAARRMLLAVGAFIFFCGGGHLIEIATLWRGDLYWLQSYWTLIGTGVSSWYVVFLIRRRLDLYMVLLSEPVEWDALKKENDDLRDLVQAMRRQLERG